MKTKEQINNELNMALDELRQERLKWESINSSYKIFGGEQRIAAMEANMKERDELLIKASTLQWVLTNED